MGFSTVCVLCLLLCFLLWLNLQSSINVNPPLRLKIRLVLPEVGEVGQLVWFREVLEVGELATVETDFFEFLATSD